jgi:hypothetical protein
MEQFEIGQTTQSDKFFRDHPKYWPAFDHVMEIGNVVFGRSYKPKNRLEVF